MSKLKYCPVRPLLWLLLRTGQMVEHTEVGVGREWDVLGIGRLRDRLGSAAFFLGTVGTV